MTDRHLVICCRAEEPLIEMNKTEGGVGFWDKEREFSLNTSRLKCLLVIQRSIPYFTWSVLEV